MVIAMQDTERKEIAALVAIGKTDEEIAMILDLKTRRQARRRVEKLMDYYKAATRTYMVVKAIAAQDLDAKELARMTAMIGFLMLTTFGPPRISPKSAPKRQHTEQVVRRALPKYDIEQYQAV